MKISVSEHEIMYTIASAVICAVNLWIYSLGVSTCLTSWRNRLTSIRIFSSILPRVPVPISPKM